MNIPSGLFNHLKRKRNVILIIFLMFTVLGMGAVEGGQAPDDQKKPKSSKKSSNKNKDAIVGTIDFHTKMLLVTVSIFTLIFVIALLVIGHFTWFADIRKKLEEEWEEELKAEEEKRVAKNILSEMVNPFDDEEAGSVSGFDYRRMSVDSVGCARGQCVPPHHSILCPNNPNVPSLNEPFSFNSSSKTAVDHIRYDSDPIEYRNRPSTEWMNLDSSVKISEPLPMRDRTESRFYLGNNHFNFSTGFLGRKVPIAPATPDPDASDMELGNGIIVSPQLKFDISKLDML